MDKSFHNSLECLVLYFHGWGNLSDLQCSDYSKRHWLNPPPPPPQHDLTIRPPMCNNPHINLPQKVCLSLLNVTSTT